MTADNGVDWSKVPMSSMDPSEVAQISLNSIGKKGTIIPGRMNKMMVMMAKRLFSIKSFGAMNGMLMKKAINSEKL